MGSDSPLDRLWHEYSLVFRDFDDLTLARWLVQTLGQLEGRGWRLSHPLVGAYRIAAQLGHQRQIWFKRLAKPANYPEADCCRAPLLPLLTRDAVSSGLVCIHCSGTAVGMADLPSELRSSIENWAARYSPIHAVAHWDEDQCKQSPHYEKAYEQAADEAEKLLALAGSDLIPQLLDYYPAAIWEDQDECLEIGPEDVLF